MRQARWTDGGVELVDVEPPPLRPGHVRLRVAACGICGSDLHRWRGELAPERGSVPGHEVAGWISDGPSGLPDALYAVEPRYRCGSCELCASGRVHLCERGGIFGVHAPGGLADWMDVPAHALHPVGAGVDARLAALAEPLAVAEHAAARGRIDSGSRVLVLGAGSLGLLCGRVAAGRGASVAITARHEHQRALAASLGLTALREDEGEAWAAEQRPDVVLETVGVEATLTLALRACYPGGRVVVLGLFASSPRIDALALMSRELELVGSNTYGHEHGSDFGRAIALLERDTEALAGLQTHAFELDALELAFRTAEARRDGAIKVTLIPDR